MITKRIFELLVYVTDSRFVFVIIIVVGFECE